VTNVRLGGKVALVTGVDREAAARGRRRPRRSGAGRPSTDEASYVTGACYSVDGGLIAL
jgi:hypothetical protein